MNQNIQKWYAVGAGIAVILIAGIWYFAVHEKALAPGMSNNGTSTSTPTVATSTGGLAQVGSIADTSTIPQPDLNRAYAPLSSLPQSVQDNNKKLYTTAVEQLKFNPNGIAYWLQLATLRKGSNDYTGAAEVWVYVSKRWPTDPIAFNNLADLYENYLHDYATATTYWNALIKLSPTNIGAYTNLATMQNINMQDKVAAKTTLQAGLTANPGDGTLQNALNQLQ